MIFKKRGVSRGLTDDIQEDQDVASYVARGFQQKARIRAGLWGMVIVEGTTHTQGLLLR